MKLKRIFAFTIIVLILSHSVFGVGIDIDALFSGNDDIFSYYDSVREASLHGEKLTLPLPAPAKNTKPYIVSFNKNASKYVIRKSLGDYPFELLAFSDERIFNVYLDDAEEFEKQNSKILRYCIPDENMASSNEYDETEFAVLDAMNADKSVTSGGNGIIVAVLDTGIEREHPCFSEATILDGWDAVKHSYGVENDADGHGTKIAGIIVGKDTGIARGSSILPIRISESGKKIMTSDLVEGIYYAADYGAKVINMSFGGYTENAAEKDAVKYAFNYGCILVASAGNEGRDPEYAGKPAFPASFEEVISVASCDNTGIPSSFSQYNEYVDVACPGENLTLYWDDGNGSYTEKSYGTSYSAAFVSGAASLAAAKAEFEIDSAYFKKLIEYSSTQPKNDHTGWGMLDLKRLLECVGMPEVSGVSNNCVYFDEVTAEFENCTATLDGEEYFSGDTVFDLGWHTLEVIGEYGRINIRFAVDTAELTYDIETDGESFFIVFKRGIAEVDGKPYKSGTKIEGYGVHKFVLNGPFGNSVSENIFISGELPEIHGVEANGVYDHPVLVSVVGSGKTYLDGVEFSSSVFVSENGSHTLTYYDSTQSKSKSFDFVIEREKSELSLSGSDRVVISKSYGWTGVWKVGRSGIDIYVSDDYSEIYRYIPTDGSVLYAAADSGKLFIATENGYMICDESAIAEERDSVIKKYVSDSRIISASSSKDLICIADENGKITCFDGDEEYILTIHGSITLLSSNSTEIFAYSAYTPDRIYRFSGNEWESIKLKYIPEGFSLFASDEALYIGGTVYKADVSAIKFIIPESGEVFFIGNNVLITSSGVYSLATGRKIGQYHEHIQSITPFDDKLILIFSTNAYLSPASNLCGSAPVEDILTGKELFSGDFEYVLPVIESAKVKDAVYDSASGHIYVICEDDNRLYTLDASTGTLIEVTSLNYVPTRLITMSIGTAVLFAGSRIVYFASDAMYKEFGGRVTDMTFYDGNLYLIVDDKLGVYDAYYETVSYPFEENRIIYDIESSGQALYVSEDETISCYRSVYDEAPIAFADDTVYRTPVIISGEYVISGSTVFDGELNKLFYIDSKIIAAKGNTVFTSDGIFSLKKREIISDFVPEYEKCVVFNADFDLFAFGKDMISIIKCGGIDPAEEVVISGIENNGVYYSDVTFSVNKGKVLLDGEQTENSFTVNTAGKHVITVLMPFGMKKSVEFEIKKSPEIIILSNYSSKLSVGEFFRLKVRFLPENTTGNVIFSTDSKSVSVSADGIITAIEEGDAIVKVHIENTELYAECKVSVTENAIICLNKDYKTDRNGEIIYGIKAETSILDFLNCFKNNEKNLRITDSENNEVTSGFIGTGMRIEKLTDGNDVIDSLTVSVLGDMDGDGRVTINDTAFIYRYLREKPELSELLFYSADLNGSGTVSSADLRQAKSIMTYWGNDYGYSDININIPTFAYEESVFYVTMRESIPDTSAVAFVGKIKYDTEVFEVESVLPFSAETAYSLSDGTVEYSVYGLDRRTRDERMIRIYFRVKNAKKAEKSDIEFTDMFISRSGAYRVNDDSKTVYIHNSPSDSLEITSSNSLLDFDETKTDYELIIPENEEYLLLDFRCPADCYVYFDNYPVYPQTTRTLNVVYVTSSGERKEYVFVVRHGEVIFPPEKETDCYLKSLSVSCGELSPAFSPDTVKYTLECSSEDVLNISAIPSSEKANINIVDNGNVVVVICEAESGDKKEYIINIVRSPNETSEEYEESSVPDESFDISEEEAESSTDNISEENSEKSVSGDTSTPQKENSKVTVYLLTAFTVLSVVFVIIIALKRRKSNKT